MELTLREHKKDLTFESNHELNKEPLRTDLLVIEKTPGVEIQKSIGAIFRIHNIWEYKGFGDELNIDTLHKLIAYTTLYKSQGKTVNAIPGTEITASICRYERPQKLFEDLAALGATVEKAYPGVYHVTGLVYFPMQIVVLKELDKSEYPELTMLNRSVSIEDFRIFLEQTFQDQGDKNNASALANVVLAGNPPLMVKLKEDTAMYKVVEEFLNPKFKEEVIDQNTLEILKNLMETQSFSPQQAMDAIKLTEEQQAKYAERLH